MSDSPAAPATTVDPVDEPIPQPPSAAPSVEVSSTEVLITTQEEVFSTAAAGAPRERRRAVRRAGAPRFLLTRCGLESGWRRASHQVAYRRSVSGVRSAQVTLGVVCCECPGPKNYQGEWAGDSDRAELAEPGVVAGLCIWV